MQTNLKALEQAKVQVVAISYDKVDILKSFAEAKNIQFPLLSDPESETIEAFKLRNKKAKGSRIDGVPHPGTFLIGQDGIVQAKFFHEGYEKRHEAEDIIKAAQQQSKTNERQINERKSAAMFDFLIVGGGVIGLSLAWELARRKQCVGVLDRHKIGVGTSHVGAGIFPPPKTSATHDPMELLRQRSHELHVEWSKRLLAETGVDNELEKCGGIHLARRVGEAVALRAEMTQAANDGVNVEELSTAELTRREPALSSIANDVKASYYLPDEMQLRPPLHLRALQTACRNEGVQILPYVDVNDFTVEHHRIADLQTSGGKFKAKNYCICSGAWAAKLLEPVDVCLPVEPWRGQLIVWKTEQPLVRHVINEGLRYLVPRRDGHLLVGATVEDVGFDDQTTEEAIELLSKYSFDLLPELSSQRLVSAMAALRPKTPDGLPFMDRVSGIENLSVSVGHYRSGLHVSPVSAVFMAELLLDDTPHIDPSSFRIHR